MNKLDILNSTKTSVIYKGDEYVYVGTEDNKIMITNNLSEFLKKKSLGETRTQGTVLCVNLGFMYNMNTYPQRTPPVLKIHNPAQPGLCRAALSHSGARRT